MHANEDLQSLALSTSIAPLEASRRPAVQLRVAAIVSTRALKGVGAVEEEGTEEAVVAALDREDDAERGHAKRLGMRLVHVAIHATALETPSRVQLVERQIGMQLDLVDPKRVVDAELGTIHSAHIHPTEHVECLVLIPLQLARRLPQSTLRRALVLALILGRVPMLRLISGVNIDRASAKELVGRGVNDKVSRLVDQLTIHQIDLEVGQQHQVPVLADTLVDLRSQTVELWLR